MSEENYLDQNGSENNYNSRHDYASKMDPWSFCQKYNGEINSTDRFWYIGLKNPDEQYLWKKDTQEFYGFYSGKNFSQEYVEKIEAQQKRIEIGFKTGELLPNLKEIVNKTAEEFAEENNSSVQNDPFGMKKVLVDGMNYLWSSNNKFVGLQLEISLNNDDYDENYDENYDYNEYNDEYNDEYGDEIIDDTMYDEKNNLENSSKNNSEFDFEEKIENNSIDNSDENIDQKTEKTIDSNNEPNENTIDHIRKCMTALTGIVHTRKECVKIYEFIKKNKGDFYSKELPPFWDRL